MAKFPTIVEIRLNEMSYFERNAYNEEYERRKKSVLIGYILLIPLGWHYAYVNKWGTQLLCWITLWGLLIWWIIDWFRIPSIIDRYNKDLSVKIMSEMALIYGQTSIPKGYREESTIEILNKGYTGKTINDIYKK